MNYNPYTSMSRTTLREKTAMDAIRAVLETEFGTEFVMKGDKSRKYAIPRQLLAYTASNMGIATSHIAAYLGYKSHQTVIHSVRLIDGLASYDRKTATIAKKTRDETEFLLACGLPAQNGWEP